MLFSIFMLALLLLSFSKETEASMTCESPYKPAYTSAIPGWQVLCCYSGVSGGKCKPTSPYDYWASCQYMFNLQNGYQCNCGSLCSGVATRDSDGNYCAGSCSCPPISGCNVTNAPTSKPLPIQSTTSEDTVPSGGVKQGGLSFTIMTIGLVLFAVFVFAIVDQ